MPSVAIGSTLPPLPPELDFAQATYYLRTLLVGAPAHIESQHVLTLITPPQAGQKHGHVNNYSLPPDTDTFAPDPVLTERIVNQRADTYLTVGRLKTTGRVNQKGTPDPNGRVAGDVISVPGLWADLDVKPGTLTLPQTRDELAHVLAALPLPPTMLVETSTTLGSLHAYWLLNQHATVELDAVRVLLKRWNTYLGRLATGVLGRTIKFDTVTDLSRVLRVPGTIRWPKTEQAANTAPTLVTLRTTNGPRYWLPNFDLVIPADVVDTTQRVIVGTMEVDSDDPLIRAYAKRGLENEAANIALTAYETGGHNALNKAAYNLGGLGAHGLLSEAEVYQTLHAAAWSRGTPTYHDYANRFDTVFQDAWTAGLAKPRPIPIEAIDAPINYETSVDATQSSNGIVGKPAEQELSDRARALIAEAKREATEVLGARSKSLDKAISNAARRLGQLHQGITKEKALTWIVEGATRCGFLVESDQLSKLNTEKLFNTAWADGQKHDVPWPPDEEFTVPGSEYFDGDKLLVQTLVNDIRGNTTFGLLLSSRTVPDNNELWHYENGVFHPDATRVVEEQCIDLLVELARPSHVTSALMVLRSGGEPMRLSDGPPHPPLINFTNYMVAYEQPDFVVPHDAKWRSTVQLTVPWDTYSLCPEYDTWVKQVLPEDCFDFMDEVNGYLLLNGNPWHKAFQLRGGGRNGKGTYQRIMRRIIGGRNCAAVSLSHLAENKFSAAELYMKTLNIAGETASGHLKNTEMFKQSVGDDVVYAERKNGQPFQYTPWAVPVFSANQDSSCSDTSEGYLSKWIVIPFYVDLTALPGGIDPEIEYRIEANELPGIARRAVAGLARLMARGRFDLPESVQEAYANFAQHSDHVRAWLADDADITSLQYLNGTPGYRHTHQHLVAWTARTDCFADYSAWAVRTGRQALSREKFYDRLKAAKLVEGRPDNERGFYGIRLLNKPQTSSEVNFSSYFG